MRTFFSLFLAFFIGWASAPQPSYAASFPQVEIVDGGGIPVAVDTQGRMQMMPGAGASIAVSSMPAMTGVVTGTVTDQYQNSSGAATPTACDKTAPIATNASAVLIAHTAGKTTYVCGYALSLDLTLSASASLIWGTGSNCGSTAAQSSGGITNAALGLLTNGSTSYGSGIGSIDQSPVVGVSDYCLKMAGGGNATGSVRYASY